MESLEVNTQQQDSGQRTETLITLFKYEAFCHSIQRVVDLIQKTVIRVGKAFLHLGTAAAFFRLIILFRLKLHQFFWRELFRFFRKLRPLLLLLLLLMQNFILHLCNFTVALYFLTQELRIVIRVYVISVLHLYSGLCCERHFYSKEEVR